METYQLRGICHLGRQVQEASVWKYHARRAHPLLLQPIQNMPTHTYAHIQLQFIKIKCLLSEIMMMANDDEDGNVYNAKTKAGFLLR